MVKKNIKLDVNKLTKFGKEISTKESLRNVTRIDWCQKVLEGKKKVVIVQGDKAKCVK